MITEPRPTADVEESLGALIDVARYPIDNPNDPVRAGLVESCRRRLAETGCARLQAFINPEALVAMAGEVDERLSQVDRTADWQNPYLSDDDETLPPDHPVRRFHYRKNAFLCRDRFGAGDWVDRLFLRMELLEFVRDCLGLTRLYHYADPMSGYLINIQEDGETFPWHFDTNEFTITVTLQKPKGGGVFEYAPAIRNSRSENHDAVAAVMAGERNRRHRSSPGTRRPADFQGPLFPASGDRSGGSAAAIYGDFRLFRDAGRGLEGEPEAETFRALP